MPANEFDLINSVMGDGIQKDKEIGITNVEFDAYEELLWMGTKSGHVSLRIDIASMFWICSNFMY